MDQRAYHGHRRINELTDVQVASFNQGNLRARRIGGAARAMLHIATRPWSGPGGQTLS